MFTSIKTSRSNKYIVTDLSRKFNLGAEMHIDDGLQLLNNELRDNPNLNGYDYLIDKIETGLNGLIQE